MTSAATWRRIVRGLGLGLGYARWPVAILGVVLLAFASTVVGPGRFAASDVSDVLIAHLRGGEGERLAEAILWQLRIPRIALALLVGAALGGAGAVTQGLFRNPLAEPGVLGVSIGAAAAVVLGFVLGLDEAALWVTPALGAAGAAAVLVALFALCAGRDSMVTLLLMGVALSAVLGALMTFLLSFTLQQWELAQKAMAWLMGSFDGRGWDYLRWGSPPLLLGLVLLAALHRPLDLLRLGEETAATLGVQRGRLRVIATAAVALTSGGATAMVGVIGFVGLVVPHIARVWVPATHAQIVPASMLIGASLLLGVDTLSRAVAPWYLAPGATMSLIGGVFVIIVLRRRGLAIEGA